MPEIGITVTDRVARPDVRDAWAVCGNSDYTIKWTLDGEWSAAHIRTAVFAWRDRYTNHSVPVIFEGNTCPMPKIPDALVCAVGLWASLPDGGEDHVLRTSSPAMITMRRSSTADTDMPVVTQDVYDELIAAVNAALDQPVHDAEAQAILAAGYAAEAQEKVGEAAVHAETAEHYCELAQQAAEGKGFIWFEIHDDGCLYMIRSKNLTDNVNARINTDGELEIILR